MIRRRWFHRSVTVAALAVLASCQQDYQFRTSAVYEAPRGRYLIRIDAHGIVRAGHDVSEQASGELRVSPSGEPGPGAPAAISIGLARRDNRILIGDGWPGDGSGPAPEAVVTGLLSQGGYSIHQDELEEIAQVIEGALAGPKGTRMPGQTRVLRVVSTSFDR